jgi:hypothetical protein
LADSEFPAANVAIMQHIRVCTLATWWPTFKDQAGELPVPIKPADAVTKESAQSLY